MPDKPPFGIMPKNIYDLQCKKGRILELIITFQRYIDAETVIPDEWINEFIEINQDFKKNGIFKK